MDMKKTITDQRSDLIIFIRYILCFFKCTCIYILIDQGLNSYYIYIL